MKNIGDHYENAEIHLGCCKRTCDIFRNGRDPRNPKARNVGTFITKKVYLNVKIFLPSHMLAWFLIC